MTAKNETGLAEGRCRGCNKRILWGRSDEGKVIPLDPTPPVYEIDSIERHGKAEIVVVRTRTAFVSHFATCSAASAFSSSRPGP